MFLFQDFNFFFFLSFSFFSIEAYGKLGLKLLFFIIASIITFFFFFVRYLQAFAIGKWDRDGKKERGLKRGEKYD